MFYLYERYAWVETYEAGSTEQKLLNVDFWLSSALEIAQPGPISEGGQRRSFAWQMCNLLWSKIYCCIFLCFDIIGRFWITDARKIA